MDQVFASVEVNTDEIQKRISMVLKQMLGNVNVEDQIVVDVQEETTKVNKIIAGQGVTILPEDGTGNVTINCSGASLNVEQILTDGVTIAKVSNIPIYSYGLSGETFDISDIGECLKKVILKLGGSVVEP